MIEVLNRISVRDLHDLLEVWTIDAHNRQILDKAAEREARRRK